MHTLFTALFLIVSAGPVHAASSGTVVGFDGAFSSGTWKVGQNPPKEIVLWSTDGSSVTLMNHKKWAESGSTIEHPTTVAAEVKFDYNYHVDGPVMVATCPGAYIIEGQYTVFTDQSSQDQSGSKSFPVKAGNIFGFALNGDGVTYHDCLNDRGQHFRAILTISNFQFTPN